MTDLQSAKSIVLDYYATLDAANEAELEEALDKHVSASYTWRGVHPFGEHRGPAAVAEIYWRPLRKSFAPIQRRPDVLLAGVNDASPTKSDVWVCQMGHLLGLFDQPWLGIPPTQRMCPLRYADFHRIDDGRVAETATFVDVIDVMRLAGCYPLPPPTGAEFIHLGPSTHGGLMFDEQEQAAGATTLALVNHMVETLSRANAGEGTSVPHDLLAETWHDDMVWWGPAGIGATYTIERYQQQHQLPFRSNLADKRFNGHVARFAEGNYACFFGWANLTNRAIGGFLGLPAGERSAEMRVVDVYRRDRDKLAENWVFIDLLHWLDMQGLDVLARMRQLIGLEAV